MIDELSAELSGIPAWRRTLLFLLMLCLPVIWFNPPVTRLTGFAEHACEFYEGGLAFNLRSLPPLPYEAYRTNHFCITPTDAWLEETKQMFRLEKKAPDEETKEELVANLSGCCIVTDPDSPQYGHVDRAYRHTESAPAPLLPRNAEVWQSEPTAFVSDDGDFPCSGCLTLYRIPGTQDYFVFLAHKKIFGQTEGKTEEHRPLRPRPLMDKEMARGVSALLITAIAWLAVMLYCGGFPRSCRALLAVWVLPPLLYLPYALSNYLAFGKHSPIDSTLGTALFSTLWVINYCAIRIGLWLLKKLVGLYARLEGLKR